MHNYIFIIQVRSLVGNYPILAVAYYSLKTSKNFYSKWAAAYYSTFLRTKTQKLFPVINFQTQRIFRNFKNINPESPFKKFDQTFLYVLIARNDC